MDIMKKFILSGAVLAMIAGPVTAADLAVKAPVYKAPVIAPVYNWTGFYVGGNLGYSFGRASTAWTIAGAPLGSTSQSMDGILGGLQAGYNWQSNNWVLGLESDIQATGQQGSSSVLTPAIPCVPLLVIVGCVPGTGIAAGAGVASTTEKLPWLGTVRARVGMTLSDRWLIYATGGLAYGEINSPGILTVGGATVGATTNTWNAGWTVGAGIEAALWENWSAKFEYLYVDLGNVGNSFVGIAPFTPITTSSHITDNIVRVGINYHFGGPIVAKY
jgi:outer membrane immunogenic protein